MQPVLPHTKLTPLPVGGGARRVPHLSVGAFSLVFLAGACTGCKIEGSWVLGGHSREKLKLLSTTSKLVVGSFAARSLKLRCAERGLISQRRGPCRRTYSSTRGVPSQPVVTPTRWGRRAHNEIHSMKGGWGGGKSQNKSQAKSQSQEPRKKRPQRETTEKQQRDST